MAQIKPVSEASEAFIQQAKQQGLSRRAIVASGRASGFNITDRDVIKVTQKRIPEQRTGRAYKADTKEIRESYIKQAKRMGKRANLRSADYRNFANELKDAKRRLKANQKTMSKKDAETEYKKARINTYWKFGLINDTERDKYLGG